MLRKLIKFMFLVCCAFPAFSQDVWLQNYFSPNSGCALSNAEVVSVLINNNSGVVMPSNTINVSYTIDGGSLTQQVLSSNLFPGASWNFSFSVTANLSACGDHMVKVWVTRAGDVNQLNDTLQWNAHNDCPVVPGNVQSSATVCAQGNSGVLNLMGWSNGTITDWQYSTNGGASWSGTGQTTPSFSFSNLTQQTLYQVTIDGGFCPDAISGAATIAVQPAPVPGTITGSDSLCISGASGILNLMGASASPLQWEFSTNSGSTWTTLANTSTSQNFTSLTQTTWYRSLVDGGVCPDVYSDTAVVYVEQLTDPGAISGSDSLCIDAASGILSLSGNIGTVVQWEFSVNNGANWSVINNSTTTENFSNLTQTTWYRAYTDGGFCPSYYSDTAVIFVQDLPDKPLIIGSDSLCSDNANGTLTLLGATSPVLQWESSTNSGASWNLISNTTTSLSFTNLPQTTWYRAMVDGGLCASIYSDTAVIYIETATVAGMLTGSDSLCIDAASGTITLSGNVGPVIQWESSTNGGANWSVINNTTATENFSALTQTTWYRVYTDAPACPGYYSDTAVIFVDQQLVVPGTIMGGDTVCQQLVGGVLTLGGYTGSITHWESSTDSGANWTIIANTLNTLNSPVITQTTWFRAYVDGLVCAGAYSDTAYVVVDAPVVVGTLNQNTQLCYGDSVQLSITGYTADNLQWESSSDGMIWSSIVGATSPNYTATNVTTDLFVHVVLENGVCPADTTNIIQLTVLPLPSVDAGSDVSILLGDSIQLAGTGGAVGVWTPGTSLSDSLVANPIASPVTSAVYTYTVMDMNGCMASDTIVITVVMPDNFDIKNIITANEDGFNDTWFIEGLAFYPSTAVAVFNVYGNEVYSSNDYQNDWEGKYNGKRLPNGTYYYIVIPGGTDSKLKGTLTIMGDE